MAVKHRSFLPLLVLLSISALQGQTRTNCQVIGNQIDCTTTTPAPTPDLTVKTSQTPLLSPEMIRALAEKRAQEFEAAENARHAAIAKFEAEISAHDVWTSLSSGKQFHVRMAEEHIVLQWIPDPRFPQGTFSSLDCEPGDHFWNCTSHATLPFPKKDRWRGGWNWRWCHFDGSVKLTSVAADRIEYEVDDIDKLDDFDIDKCRPKRTTHKLVVLIPRQVGQ
jgi:hypothetical protein